MIRLAGCVITDDSNKIGLLHRNTTGSKQWELPGGKIEANESEEAAATRELEEELGIVVEIISKLDSVNFSDETRDYQYTWFRARVVDGTPEIHEPQTFDKFDYFSTDQMERLNLSANMRVMFEKLKNGMDY